MNRLRKYVERMPGGRQLRTAYAMTAAALPDPRPQSQWGEEASFSAADELLKEPELKTTFKAAIDRGYAIAPTLGLKAKGK